MKAPAASTTDATAALERARLLPRTFFSRDPRLVARELLGKLLVRRESGAVRAGRVMETEAYLGVGDPAAHAAAGLTPRTAVLFGPPGYAYVYFIYGNHFCLNVSCQPEGEAGSVLFRGLTPVLGGELMALARGLDRSRLHGETGRSLTNGPGRLAQALGITRLRDNGKDLTDSASDLVLMDDGFRPEGIAVTPRIGITKAAQELLRYVLAENRPSAGSGRHKTRRPDGSRPARGS
jgi:DNA-3-methyladenine glycosylase